MKSVKENFNRHTSQRFEEYNKRMQEKRQKCKEQCEKDIQKIIVKDKIQKSLAEKVETCCLKCGCVLGGAVAPVWGLVSGLVYAGWSHYVTQTAIQKGIEAGVSLAVQELKGFSSLYRLISISKIENFVTPTNYFHKMSFVKFVQDVYNTKCLDEGLSTEPFCNWVSIKGQKALSEGAAQIADNAMLTSEIAKKESLDGALALTTYSNAIIASIVAIVVIALVMLIIYFILRYRRKTKMNKKLQYTKLLNQ
ncbi:PIR protein [Plasmodium sp.]|nr:PIR protein [Plasmodium sp.]